MTPGQRELLSEVCQLFQLLLVIPAVSERSFSAFTKSENVFVFDNGSRQAESHHDLHIHRGLTDDLSLIESASRFIHGSDHREQIFGKFVATDINKCD